MWGLEYDAQEWSGTVHLLHPVHLPKLSIKPNMSEGLLQGGG